MSPSSYAITGEQIRAARALARLGQTELAALSGLSLETIKRLERTRGAVQGNVRTLSGVHHAFSGLGVTFQNDRERSGVNVTVGARDRSPSTKLRMAIPPASDVQRLIYVSVAMTRVPSQTAIDLLAITETSMKRNATLSVTGALLFVGGFYLQVLEGGAKAVHSVFSSIKRDDRHTNIRLLQDEPVRSRQFSDWSMCTGILAQHDPIVLNYPGMEHGFEAETLSLSTAKMLLSLVQGRHPRLRVPGMPTSTA